MALHQLVGEIDPKLLKINESTSEPAGRSYHAQTNSPSSPLHAIPITHELLTFAAHFRRKPDIPPAKPTTEPTKEEKENDTSSTALPAADPSQPSDSQSSTVAASAPSANNSTSLAAESVPSHSSQPSTAKSSSAPKKKKKKTAGDKDDAFLDSILEGGNPLDDDEKRKAKNRKKKERERATRAKESGTDGAKVDAAAALANGVEQLALATQAHDTPAPESTNPPLSASQRKKLKKQQATATCAPSSSPSATTAASTESDPVDSHPTESSSTSIAAADSQQVSGPTPESSVDSNSTPAFIPKKQSRAYRVEDEEDWSVPIVPQKAKGGKKKNASQSAQSNQSKDKSTNIQAATTKDAHTAQSSSSSSSTSSASTLPLLGPVPLTQPFVPTFPNLLRAFHQHKQGQQEDAQEFLQILCENIQREWTEWTKNWKSHLDPHSTLSSPTQFDTSDSSDDWNEIGKGSKAIKVVSNLSFAPSPLSRIFCGRVRSQLQVASRSTDTMSFQPFFALHLDIENEDENTKQQQANTIGHHIQQAASTSHRHRKKAFTIDMALERYMCPNEIEGYKKRNAPIQTDWYGTPIGPATTKALHMHALDSHSLPRILVLHLKRFEQVGLTGRTVKSTKSVQFNSRLSLPLRYLSTASNTPNPQTKGVEYDLIGVVVHLGHSMQGGHYIAYVRDQTLEANNGKADDEQDATIQKATKKPTKLKGKSSARSSTFQFDESDQDESESENGSNPSTSSSSSAREIWYQCDDARITPVPAHQVYSQQAYLLFYTIRE